MKRFLLAALLFLCSSAAQADIIQFRIDSATYNDGSYFVGQYNSDFTVNNGGLYVPVQSYCVDFTSHVSFGETFDVQVVNLANFAGPAAVKLEYWEAGFLAFKISQTTDLTTISNLQRAIWLITTPGSTDPYLNTAGSLADVLFAQQNYLSFDQSNVTLYLKVGDIGQNQISVVPEPTTYAILGMFGAGTISLVGFRRLFRQ